jgi:hypothetical protein
MRQPIITNFHRVMASDLPRTRAQVHKMIGALRMVRADEKRYQAKLNLNASMAAATMFHALRAELHIILSEGARNKR